MDREEILKKSRQENDISDERTECIGLKEVNFSISVLVFLWIVLSRGLKLRETAQYTMQLLAIITCFFTKT